MPDFKSLRWSQHFWLVNSTGSGRGSEELLTVPLFLPIHPNRKCNIWILIMNTFIWKLIMNTTIKILLVYSILEHNQPDLWVQQEHNFLRICKSTQKSTKFWPIWTQQLTRLGVLFSSSSESKIYALACLESLKFSSYVFSPQRTSFIEVHFRCKKFWSEKNFRLKKFGLKNIWSKKSFGHEKHFWSEKIMS